MTAFSGIEKHIARTLEWTPGTKAIAKRSYQIANYFACREKGFIRWLAEGVYIVSELPSNGGEAFFGYYDKTPWSPLGEEVVVHGIRDRYVEIYRVKPTGERPVKIGESSAWSWQQGCMAQWAGRGKSLHIVFNGIREGVLGSYWAPGYAEGGVTFCPWPVQAVRPDGGEFVALNYLRLALLRPEYGYDVTVSNFSAYLPDEKDGLWRVEWPSGRAELMVTLAELKHIMPISDMRKSKDKVNHALYSPSGKRVAFVHRWYSSRGKKSRLFIKELESGDLNCVLDTGMVSHYCWRDDRTLFVYCRIEHEGVGYYMLDVATGEIDPLGFGELDRYGDGHPSVSPSGRYLLTDSYPDRRRQQHLLVYDLTGGTVTELGRFLLPLRFDGKVRVDLHPRWSPCGGFVSIDTACMGRRNMAVLDVREVLGG